jgi:leucyl aminopeptidase
MINLISDNKILVKNEIISLILGYYKFNLYKSDIKENKSKVYFYCPKLKLKDNINNYIYEAQIQNEIRNLINMPSNILNSETFLSYIKENIPEDIKVSVINESKLKKLGCNLILGVNQGSKNKAMMIILEYKNDKEMINKNKNIALIGKGVMYDSGGLNLKKGDFTSMKYDMAGSSIIFGIFKLLSKFKMKGNYIGILPIVENLIDSNSIKPGDILKSYNGKTVEVTNTDAEGRLIMADALAYSEKYNPYICIDIATLTAQAAQLFDYKSSIIMGNNNKYLQLMINSGIENNEKIWELPMWEEYINMTKSDIADLKNNTYSSNSITIMAGAFLSNFIPKNTNWIHLDIGGRESCGNNNEMRNYGASGEIMRSVLTFFEKINL